MKLKMNRKKQTPKRDYSKVTCNCSYVGRYFIRPAHPEEVHEGLVWIKDPNIRSRTIVEIYNAEEDKGICCEALSVDPTDVVYWQEAQDNDLVVFMNGYYRRTLVGVKEFDFHNLTVTPASGINKILYSIRAGFDHPQAIVKINTALAVASIFVTAAGVVLSYVFWKHPIALVIPGK